MPRIHRAEFLSYYNARRNSDKLFNVFLIEDDDGTFRCASENGRRGTTLVRRTLCSKTTRPNAERHLRQKLSAKRNHRETPYTDEPFGQNYSQIAREYGFAPRSTESVAADSNRATRQSAPLENTPAATRANVIAFPVEKKENPKNKPQPSGIFNQGQFDSLEF